MRGVSEFTVGYALVTYHDNSGSKTRPVVVVKLNGEKITFYKITSQFENKSEYIKSKYYEIKDWLRAGLTKPSWVDTIQSITVNENEIEIRVVGRFSNRDILGLREFLTSR
ncbi:hypothetical protein [Streptococcus sp. zg-JUN1979]|uniref:hypothetical protein n=1 Tax=Streptococcus sp. zg-JUN1979 TaxID=3391450 RepID=UPI0039A43127